MSTETTVTTYVQHLYKGIVDSPGKPVLSNVRDVAVHTRITPPEAFGFRFYDQASASITVDGQRIGLVSKPFRESGWYYIDPEVLTYDDVKALGHEYRILLDNMRINRWSAVFRTRTGNYEPVQSTDEIVHAKPIGAQR